MLWKPCQEKGTSCRHSGFSIRPTQAKPQHVHTQVGCCAISKLPGRSMARTGWLLPEHFTHLLEPVFPDRSTWTASLYMASTHLRLDKRRMFKKGRIWMWPAAARTILVNSLFLKFPTFLWENNPLSSKILKQDATLKEEVRVDQSIFN